MGTRPSGPWIVENLPLFALPGPSEVEGPGNPGRGCVWEGLPSFTFIQWLETKNEGVLFIFITFIYLFTCLNMCGECVPHGTRVTLLYGSYLPTFLMCMSVLCVPYTCLVREGF